MIPEEFIDQLLDRVDLVELVGAEVSLQKKGKDYLGLCPFHSEKTPSFNVIPNKQFYHCFGCGQSGNALTFLLSFKKMGFVEAVEFLAEKTGMQVPKTVSARPAVDASLYDLLAQAKSWFVHKLEHSETAREYLASRGISAETASAFDIGFAPAGWDNLLSRFSVDYPVQRLKDAGLIVETDSRKKYDYFRHRLMFPVRDSKGRVIAFAGRSLTNEQQPKYINSPGSRVFQKKQHLYGLYQALSNKSLDRLFFVEGYMDVITLVQAGISGVVACMGTAVGDFQLKLAYRYVKELVFCFDGDNAGMQAAWKTLKQALPSLGGEKRIRFIFLPEGSDPDSFVSDRGAEAFYELFEQSVRLPDFFFDYLSRELDLASIDGRNSLATAAVPLIRTIRDDILRRLFEKKLQDLIDLPVADLASRPPPRLASKAGASTQYSLLKHALQQLVIAPEAASRIADKPTGWLSVFDDYDAVLLDKVIRVLKESPTDKTPVLLAQFAGSPEYRQLVELSVTDTLLPNEQRQRIFEEDFESLRKRSVRMLKKRRIEARKAAGEAPSPEELERT